MAPGRAAPTESSRLLADELREDAHRPEPAGYAPRDGAPRDGSRPVARNMHLLLPAVGIGIYLVAVDQLLTVASYAKMGSELNALSSISWVATSYFLTLTSFQPLYGRLSDAFGRKACLLFAYAVFALGCLGCGLARDLAQLCAARAVAGVGGGGINAVVAILLSDLVPLRDIGVSVSSALLQHLLRAQLAARLPSGRLARLIEHRVRQNIDLIRELPPRVARVVRDSYHLATLGALAPTVVSAAAALLASFWVRARLVKG